MGVSLSYRRRPRLSAAKVTERGSALKCRCVIDSMAERYCSESRRTHIEAAME
jgi:hypothetical protein